MAATLNLLPLSYRSPFRARPGETNDSVLNDEDNPLLGSSQFPNNASSEMPAANFGSLRSYKIVDSVGASPDGDPLDKWLEAGV